MKVVFLKCKHCGKVIAVTNRQEVPTICCGELMEELKANTVDAAIEKHVPVVTQNDAIIRVKVASVEHPMTLEHHISFIAIETNLGVKINHIPVDRNADTAFLLAPGEIFVRAYEYCNLHGLWSSKEIIKRANDN